MRSPSRLISELELGNQGLQLGGHPLEGLSGLRRFACAHGRGVGGFGHAADVLADFAAASGGFGEGAADFVGGCALLFDGAGNCGLDIADLADDLADLVDGRDCPLGVALNGFNFAADVFGCLGGLFGELLDFIGDYGEALARLAGARRFDGGI